MSLPPQAATHSRIVQLTRTKKELLDFERNPRCYIKEVSRAHKCREIYLFKVRGDGDIYQNSVIPILVDISVDYPFKAPQVKIAHQMHHPNIDADTGELCSAQLMQENWKPETTIEDVLINFICLLNDPDLSRPVNFSAAEDFFHNRRRYNDINRELAKKMSS